MSMTYESLNALLINYTQRTDPDFIAAIPSFVDNAQRRVARDFKVLGIEQQLTTEILANNYLVPKPIDWIDTICLFIKYAGESDTQYTPLLLRDYSFLLYYNQNREPGRPQIYADFSYSYWSIATAPDQNCVLRMQVFTLPTLLSNSVQTNTITLYFPDALLKASLVEAFSFIDNQALKQTYEAEYQTTKAGYITDQKMRKLDSTSF